MAKVRLGAECLCGRCWCSWLTSGKILKVEPPEFVDGLDVT